MIKSRPKRFLVPIIAEKIFFVTWVVTLEIDICCNMNNEKCLLDPAPVKLMRQCPQVIFPLIRVQFIINKSFKESHVPCQLKQATITPIIKGTDLDA